MTALDLGANIERAFKVLIGKTNMAARNDRKILCDGIQVIQQLHQYNS